PEEECKWVINFFEVFNITFAIHADNVQYNLIKMGSKNPENQSVAALDTYRVFSQLRDSASLEGTQQNSSNERTTPNTSNE
ncbi:MAG: hypothetical protein ICV54_30315, partial [Nostoc sp. C3-bin3]|nr:hypothetical protein [Nostoc sp. C3-bin3]